MKLRNTLDAMSQTIDELASLGSNLAGWQADQHVVEIAHLRRQLATLEAEFASPRPKRFVRKLQPTEARSFSKIMARSPRMIDRGKLN